MIIYDSNFLSDQEIDQLLELVKNEPFTPRRYGVIYSDQIELANTNHDLSFIKNNLFDRKYFGSIRINRYDETIQQSEVFHGHKSVHNYVIFLNDNFENGELEFEDGLLIKPKKGSVVYFTNNEKHRVLNCKGVRLSLIISGSYGIDMTNFSIKRQAVIL